MTPNLLPELVRRARALGWQAIALGDVLQSLPPNALVPLVQARACVKLATLASDLDQLADAIGVQVDPQREVASCAKPDALAAT